MNESSLPHLTPAVPTAPAKPRSVRRAVFVMLGSLAALVVLGIGSMWIHTCVTPTFAEYLERCPAGEDRFRADWSAVVPLSGDGSWREGDVDPFAVAEGDAAMKVQRNMLRSRFLHGEELLAEVQQEVWLAVGVVDDVRRGIGVRTTVTGRAPNVRVRARVWIDGSPLTGPDSLRVGSITGEVVLLGGAGEDRLEVARAPAGGLAALPEPPTEGPLEILLSLLSPFGLPDPAGFTAMVSRRILLTEARVANGSQSIGCVMPEMWVNTLEYSYGIEQAVTYTHGSTSHAWSRKLSRGSGAW